MEGKGRRKMERERGTRKGQGVRVLLTLRDLVIAVEEGSVHKNDVGRDLPWNEGRAPAGIQVGAEPAWKAL